MAKKESSRKGGSFRRRLFWAAAFLLVFYVGIHVLSRTEGVRTLLNEKLTEWAGQSVTVRSCSATPLLGLNIYGLDSQGIKSERITAEWDYLFWLSERRHLIRKLTIETAQVQLHPSLVRSGSWDPAVFNELLSGIGQVVGVTSAHSVENASGVGVPKRLYGRSSCLFLENATIEWLDARRNKRAGMTGVVFSTHGAAVGQRDIRQYEFAASQLEMAQGQRVNDIEFESASIVGYAPWLVLKFSSRSMEYEAFEAAAHWEDLAVRVRNLAR